MQLSNLFLVILFLVVRKAFTLKVFIDDKVLTSVKLLFYNPYSGKEVTLTDDPFIIDYNRTIPLKVLIHGWRGHRDHATVQPIKNAYIDNGNVNLIVVDWSYGSQQSYLNSRYYVEPIGDQIGKLLNLFMTNHNINAESIHLIGHSLGAHVAGGVGRFFNGTIGRITALDPAGPLFHPESKDAINSADALFVDSVHTSAGILGQMRPSVDVSFYPNRGYPPQPGCTALDFFLFGRCSHHRASLFFAESIYWPENFEGLKCDMDDILNAPCQQIENQTDIADIAFMGEAVNRSTRGTYYLETNSVAPFGKGRTL